jgi:glutamate carboxypeptidase
MAEGDGPALLAWLRGQEAEMCGLLERLLLVESPTARPESHPAVRAILEGELGRLSFRVRRLAGEHVGDHLYARPRQRRRGVPYQLLVGHFDTVWPLGTLAQMPVRVEDGELYGPGAFDMKAGLVEILFALRALAALELEPAVLPVVLMNADEEVGSVESRRWIAMLARGAERAYILEGAFGPSGKLKTSRKGVGRFLVTVRGKAGHAGVAPQSGASAILEISHQIQRLYALNDHDRGITVNVGTVDGGLRPNVIAPVAKAEVDVRVPTVEAAREMELALLGLEPVHGGISLEVTGGFGRLPMAATDRNLALWETARSAAEALGLEVEHVGVGGASDGNITSLYTATLDGLGPVGDGAHAVDERIVIARLPERTALLALLLLAPAGPSGAGASPG